MKRLLILLLLSLSLPLSAKENWILSTSLNFPYFADTFSPGFSLKADVIMFPWDLEKDPGNDGYGISLEGGMLFPIRKQYSGSSPFFKIGVFGRKDMAKNMSLDVRAHLTYALIGSNLPGNGLKPRRITYQQNIGITASSSFIYKVLPALEVNTGLELGLLFPLQSTEGRKESPEIIASCFIGATYNIQ